MNRKHSCFFCNSNNSEQYANEILEVYRWVKKNGSIQKEKVTIILPICKSCYRKIHPIKKPYSIAVYVCIIVPLLFILTLCSKSVYLNFWTGALLFLTTGAIAYGIIFGLFWFAISLIQDAFTPSMKNNPFCDMPVVHELHDYGFFDNLGDDVDNTPPAELNSHFIFPLGVIKEHFEKKYSCTIQTMKES